MQTPVAFDSDGLRLSGVVHIPEGLKPSKKRPAMLVLHGFGTSKTGGSSQTTCEMFARWGVYRATFRLQGMRGKRGRTWPRDLLGRGGRYPQRAHLDGDP